MQMPLKAVGMDPIVLEGLHTFDQSHLYQPSAERGSSAFLQVASSIIQSSDSEREG